MDNHRERVHVTRALARCAGGAPLSDMLAALTPEILISRMADLDPKERARIRTLSLGPVPWGAWSWTFHNGSCWAALAYADGVMIAWAILTREADEVPVIGAYVHPDHRRTGLGEQVVDALLAELRRSGDLNMGDVVFASTWRWSKWSPILERHGLRCVSRV